MNDFVLIRKNLFRKKLRAILMIVSIFVAFLIFGVLASFYRAFNAGEEVAAADRLVVVNKINFTQPLPIAYFNRVRASKACARLTHLNWFGGYYQDPKNFLIVFAVEPETYMDGLRRHDSTSRRRRSRPSCASAPARWSARRWRGNGAGRSATACRSRATSSRRRTARAPGTSPSSASSAGNKPQVDTNFMVFQYAYFDETRSFGKDQIGWMVLQTDVAVGERAGRQGDRSRCSPTLRTRPSTDTEKAFNKAFVAQIGNIALIVGAGGRRGLRHHPDDRRQHHGA